MSTVKDHYMLQIQIDKHSTDVTDPEFSFTINGRKTRGFDEEAFFDGDETVMVTRKIPLIVGENEVEINVIYNDVIALTEKVLITRQVSKKEKKQNKRLTTQLWFFGVGISDYEKSSQNLEFAHRDALELEKQFLKQEGKLYSKVNTRVLTNKGATERDIRVEMNDFLRLASAEDVIVIFIAGHGVQDNKQNLYLITHDADMKRPYTGMDISKFRDYLDQRPINQKAIFLMDICHAGTVGPRKRGRVTSEDVIKQLSDGTGTIVFASSSGAESSLEDESYGGGHGAFTYALLEGLKGQADLEAGDENGTVTIQELVNYTARKVIQITDGVQHPNIPSMVNVSDFPLTKQ